MKFTATIEVPDSYLSLFTAEEIREGIHARLYPVVSCDPDETIASSVTVSHA